MQAEGHIHFWGNFIGATCQWWMGPEAEVGRATNVSSTLVHDAVPTHTQLSSLHPDKQEALSRFQGHIPARQKHVGCEAEPVRGMAWREVRGPYGGGWRGTFGPRV